MIKIKIYIILLLLISYSCTNTQEGNQNQEKTKSLRIISLVPSITTEITQLGLENNIVGATSYCDVSKKNKELIVGSAIDINEEKILLLKPDIVLASTLIKEKSINILKQNGINIQYLGKIESFNDICEQFIKLGQLLDKENTAKEIVAKAEQKLDSLTKLIPKNNTKPKVFFQLGANPIAAVIPNTYMNDFITFTACDNIFYDLDKIIVTRESVLLRNPDYIFISSMGSIEIEEKQNWKNYKNVNAVKNNNVFIVKSATNPTVIDFINVLEFIINKIYFN